MDAIDRQAVRDELDKLIFDWEGGFTPQELFAELCRTHPEAQQFMSVRDVQDRLNQMVARKSLIKEGEEYLKQRGQAS